MGGFSGGFVRYQLNQFWLLRAIGWYCPWLLLLFYREANRVMIKPKVMSQKVPGRDSFPNLLLVALACWYCSPPEDFDREKEGPIGLNMEHFIFVEFLFCPRENKLNLFFSCMLSTAYVYFIEQCIWNPSFFHFEVILSFLTLMQWGQMVGLHTGQLDTSVSDSSTSVQEL